MKPLFIFIALQLLLFSSVKDIENKIDNNKKRYNNELKNKKDLDKQIKYLANLINKEELRYKNIVQILDNTNTTLMLNRLKLNRAKESLIKLQKSSANLETSKKQIEDDVINFVIEKYSMSMGIKQANKETLQELVDKEVYSLVLDNAKQEVLDLNIDYLKVNRKRRKNIDKTTQLSTFIDEQEQKYKEYLKMSDDQKKVIGSLEKKHKEYQQHLEKIIKKQNKITDLLGSLNILKKQEIDKQRAKERKAKAKAKKAKALKAKKEKERLAKERKAKKRLEAKKIKISKKPKQQEVKTISREALDEDIDIEVRKLGSSTKGIKISKYRGSKTIAPLKSYTITKKFGKYYDEVYKMELFNESVSLKTKKANAKVLSVFKGQIVYAKQNSGLLENVVIVKHKNNLHTIYSHLDKISPTLSVGKWIPKGYVVGRVNDTLLFQATKDSKYIDPEKLFK